MVEKNSSHKVCPEAVKKIEEEASQNWDKFYGIHQVTRESSEKHLVCSHSNENHFQNRFFKDRNWLFTEFPELASPLTRSILELGCGVGNTVFPILEQIPEPDLTVYCCDFSPQAIDLVKCAYFIF
jgi:methylase of polypeptide subunit release factors